MDETVSPSRSRKRPFIISASVVCVIFAGDVALRATPSGWLWVALVLIKLWPVFFIMLLLTPVGLFMLIGHMEQHKGRRSLRWPAGVILTLAVFLYFPLPSMSLAAGAARMTQVFIWRSTLQQMSQEAQARGASPPLAFLVLDGFGSMGSGLLYDPSDEILLPMERRSEGWKAAAEPELLATDPEITPVFGHYYSWFHF